MSLSEYNKKRNFENTTEPIGKTLKTKNLRFVIQYHQARAKHYDFRLEYNGVLISWAVPKGLSLNPKDKRLAVQVEDHPVSYIDFEGIIPKGNYGAGTVEIFDSGNYAPLEDFEKGLKKGHIKFVLMGEKVKGAWSLLKIKDNNWLIIKIDDEFASGKTNKKTKLPFKSAEVQLATLTDKIPKGKNWVFEIKYDGYRIVSFIENGNVKMFSRNNIDYTSKFKNIAAILKKIETPCILDGEIVKFDENGKTDFGLLQHSIKSKENDFYYVIFDILAIGDKDLRNLQLLERKEKLERLLYKTDNHLIYSSHFLDGEKSFEFAKKNNLEGIIAKKSSSKYMGKRNEDWLKIKCYLRQEFVIIGYTTSEKNELISALLLGYYEKEKLVYVGKVGTGFNEKDKIELNKKFQPYQRKNSHFKNFKEKNITWLKPKYVCEIQYAELTKENLLRQPSFIALRADKKPKEITLEKVK